MLSLYKNIHDLRVQNKMTQLELADRLGYTRSMIAKIEAGKVDLARSKIYEFAKVFGVSASELMGDDGTEQPIDTEEAKAIRDSYINDTLSIEDRELLDLYHSATPEDRQIVDLALKRKSQKP